MKIYLSQSTPMYYEPIHEFSEDEGWLKNALVECKTNFKDFLNIEGTVYNFSVVPHQNPVAQDQNIIWLAKNNKLNFYLRYEKIRIPKIKSPLVYTNLIFSKTGKALDVYKYLIESFGGLCSSKVHTKKGMDFWKKLIKDVNTSYKIVSYTEGKIKKVLDIDSEWSKDRDFQNSKILILKNS